MGIIEQKNFKIYCENCDITEKTSAVEKGSAAGSAGWTDFKTVRHFTLEVIDDDIVGPKITKALCKKCEDKADVKQINSVF